MIRKIILLLMAGVPVLLSAATNDLARFSGTVVDLGGKPVTDAVVECFHFPTRSSVGMPEIESKQFRASDTNGGYEFSVPAGAVIVTVKKAGFGSVWKTWQSAPSGIVEPLMFRPASFLAGLVVDENDQPVTNAVVSVSAAADRGKGEWSKQPNFLFGKAARDLFSASTSADGRFRIVNFPAGAEATLDVSAPGKALRAGSRGGMQFQTQAGQEDIKLVTDSTASVEGKVVRRDTGEPLANVKIQLEPVNAGGGITVSPAPTQSGADGAFHIPEVPAGSYRIAGIFTNQPVPSWVTESVAVTVAPGETLTNVKISAFKGGVVKLTVVGKSNQRVVPEVNVSAFGEGYPASGVTSVEGVAWFRLPPGQFVLFGKKLGLAQAETQAMVAEGLTNYVRLELGLPLEIAVNEPKKSEEPPSLQTQPRLPPQSATQSFSPRPLSVTPNPSVRWPRVVIVLFVIGAVVFWMAQKRKP
jgi:uncharacterized GH25 family protein